MELVLLIGVPGVGKSTFCEQYLTVSHVRVNLDTLKRRPRELRTVQACIANGQSLVIDNTNVLAFDRARYIPLTKAAGYRVIGYVFECPVEDAIQRNAKRSSDSRVPSHVICAFNDKFQPPTWDEGFDELWRVTVANSNFVGEPVARTSYAVSEVER